MADLSGLRESIETLGTKLTTLREVVTQLREGALVQDALDDLKTRVDEISDELDAIIAEARGESPDVPGEETPGEETPPEEPPTATQLPA